MTKILVIDDKKDNLIAVKALLKNLEPEYEVLTAQSGIEGIKIAQSKQPDTILLDVHMPQMDGYEVCRRLRADKKTDHIPIIYLTAVKTSVEDRIKGLELGGDSYLTKPIDEGELLANLHAMLRIKKAEDKLLHQYKHIVSSSTDMLALLDKQFTYLATNQAYLDAFKKTSDEVVGHKVPEIFGEEFFETVIKPHVKRCLAGEIVNYQEWFDFPAYEKRFMDITYYPYIGENNQVEGFVVSGRNITERKRAEEALRWSQANLVAAQRIAHLGSWEWDVLADTALWSDETYRMFGAEPGELEKHRQYFLDRVHPDDRDRVNQALSDAINGTKEYNLEYRIVLPDKIEKVIQARAEVIRDDDGKAVLMRGTVHDITERKRAEEALQDALNELQQRQADVSALLKGSRAVLENLEFETAAQAIFDSFKKLIGATAGYVALLTPNGTENEVLFLDSGGLTCTADPSLPMPIRGLRAKAYKTGKAVFHNDFSNSEWVEFMPEGHVDLYNVLFAPLIIEDKAVGLMGVANKPGGFTEKDAKMASAFGELAAIALRNSRMLESLKESEEKYRGIFDESVAAIYVFDTHKNFIDSNQAGLDLLGYSREELLKMSISQVDTDPEAVLPAHEKLLAGDRIVNYEHKLKRKDGRIITVLNNSRPLIDIDGNVVGMQSTLIDITRRKRAEEALQESEERFRTFFENTAIGIYRTTPDGRILMGNPSLVRMLGYSSLEELTQRNLNREGFDPEYPRSTFINRIEKQGQVIGLESAWARQDGTTIFISESAKAVRDETGNTLYYEGTIEDITERKRAEEELRRSEERYRSILDNIEEGYYEVDLKGNFMFFNDSLCRMLNYSRDELLGMNNREYMDSESAERVYKIFNKVFRTEKSSQTIDIKIKRKEGTINYGEISISLLKDRNNKPVGFRGIVRDITERKRAEKALLESEESYRGLYDHATDAIYIQDKEGRFLDVNQGAVDMYGYPKEFFIGKTPEPLAAPGKNDMKQIAKYIERAFEGEPQEFEFWGKRQNGEVFPKIVRLNKSQYFGREVIFAFASDMTESKRAEEALREAHELLQTTYNTLLDAIISTDMNYNIISCNKAVQNIFGYTPDELVGKNYSILVSKEMFEDPRQPTKQEELFKKGYLTSDDYYFKRKNGEIFPARFSVAVTRDEQGNPTGLVGSVHDITDRKRAEEELKKKMQELDHANRLMVGRELKMIELKREVNELLVKTGQPKKYSTPEEVD